MKKKVAIVTGAAQGMGYGVAINFLKKGYKVVFTDINIDKLKKNKKKIFLNSKSSDFILIDLDITNFKSCKNITSKIFKKWSKIDVLVNCAGIAGGNSSVEDMNESTWKKVVDINLNGTFNICKSVINYMKKNNFGRIVTISSMAGKDGNPNASHYSSSKAGVIAFTKSLGKELAEENITVNCIAPAVIKTPMIKDVTENQLNYMIDKIPMKRMGEISDIVNLINYLTSSKTSFSTGAVFDLSGGRATY
ncbi:MAG: SDR family NAD(P)-dependent oxidoreductase [Alphaproteobacteria bacterium]